MITIQSNTRENFVLNETLITQREGPVVNTIRINTNNTSFINLASRLTTLTWQIFSRWIWGNNKSDRLLEPPRDKQGVERSKTPSESHAVQRSGRSEQKRRELGLVVSGGASFIRSGSVGPGKGTITCTSGGPDELFDDIKSYRKCSYETLETEYYLSDEERVYILIKENRIAEYSDNFPQELFNKIQVLLDSGNDSIRSKPCIIL